MSTSKPSSKRAKARVWGIVVCALAVLFVAAVAMGHGGKKHASGEFTALKALQEATELYERLVTGGKLVESWETELAQVKISTRHRKENKEFVVAFHRSKGEPNTVYIFFSDNGKYAGSNFTGE
jgi:hypothetical protein